MLGGDGRIVADRGHGAEHLQRVILAGCLIRHGEASDPERVAELTSDGSRGRSGVDRADRAVEVEQEVTGAADDLRDAAAGRHGWSRLTVVHRLSNHAWA